MCILCAQVREQLTKANVPFSAVEVTDLAEQERLVQRYGARSFPMLVLRGKYVGGYTHLVHLLASGRLAAAIEDIAEIEDLGERELRGMVRPVPVRNVVRLKAQPLTEAAQ